ncbi:HEAT repeat domain-containing protein [Pseudactinotalea sp. HY158]|uniref:HEAT repeat domain-containing protein n=1 Tax=Pseudactinotalea sp. HY158 TaxID=2654547 RepID=UPI00129C4523|nr:HEAT repeat domain-containing protein [Pseudactinotalea sp. HY158]QGH69753.1 HEAT repeat domain-containing protein [Pseudactinotalea sp. HY158]
MTHTDRPDPAARLRHAFAAADSSSRLQAALAAGTDPEPDQLTVLVDQCALEPDFFVRDMLTWALTRHPEHTVVPLVLAQLDRVEPQARSQALHTLSKIGDPATWSAITPSLLHDVDDEIARAAWRAAVVLVPSGGEGALASELAAEFGRGGRDVQLSLSRALVALGERAAPAIDAAATSGEEAARTHAVATGRLLEDPDEGFESAIFEARRLVALGP